MLYFVALCLLPLDCSILLRLFFGSSFVSAAFTALSTVCS